MRQRIILLFCLVLFIGCDDSSNEPSVEPELTPEIRQIAFDRLGLVLEYYNYNLVRRITAGDQHLEILFEYRDLKISKRTTYSYYILQEVETYTYNSNGELFEVNHSNGNTDQYTYSYEGNERTIFINDTLHRTETIINGNCTQVVYSGKNESIFSMDYDTSVNLFGAIGFSFNPSSGSALSMPPSPNYINKNNIKTGSDSNGAVVNYEYSYNKEGLVSHIYIDYINEGYAIDYY